MNQNTQGIVDHQRNFAATIPSTWQSYQHSIFIRVGSTVTARGAQATH